MMLDALIMLLLLMILASVIVVCWEAWDWGKEMSMNRISTYGLEAATDHTFSYLGRYLLLGFLPLGVVAFFDPGFAIILGILHVVSVALLFPGALLINRVALRVARTRTWDLQPWRAWAASILAVVLEWGTVAVSVVLFDDGILKVPLRDTIG